MKPVILLSFFALYWGFKIRARFIERLQRILIVVNQENIRKVSASRFFNFLSSTEIQSCQSSWPQGTSSFKFYCQEIVPIRSTIRAGLLSVIRWEKKVKVLYISYNHVQAVTVSLFLRD